MIFVLYFCLPRQKNSRFYFAKILSKVPPIRLNFGGGRILGELNVLKGSMRNIEILCERTHVNNVHAHHKAPTRVLSSDSTMLGNKQRINHLWITIYSTTVVPQKQVVTAAVAAETASSHKHQRKETSNHRIHSLIL